MSKAPKVKNNLYKIQLLPIFPLLEKRNEVYNVYNEIIWLGTFGFEYALVNEDSDRNIVSFRRVNRTQSVTYMCFFA